MEPQLENSVEKHTLDLTIIQSDTRVEDYSDVLRKYGVAFIEADLYLEVGVPSWTQGWIIDIAVIPAQFLKLTETVLPLLIRENVVFKIAKTASIARGILGGEFGYLQLGKLISIFPSDDKSCLAIAKQLIELTASFRGPHILTDRNLAGVIFTRYGAGQLIVRMNERGIEEIFINDALGRLIVEPYNIPFQIPRGIDWPFSSITTPHAPKEQTVLQDKYRPMYILKEDAKGSVKKGLYLEKWWRIKWCVIKEGKLNMIGDSKGRDMTDRLRWQYELHNDLKGTVPLPDAYDLFEENGHTYLVMEYIKGEALDKIALAISNGRIWQELPQPERLQLLDYALQVLDIIERMHQKGYVHRDITPANFLVNKKQHLKMIDLELSYNINLRKPYPPFRLGTPGYMSPEQQGTKMPKFEQDVYAIGGLFVLLFTGLHPEKYALEMQSVLKDQLAFFIPDQEIANILCACLSEEPEVRPAIVELKRVINLFRGSQTAIEDTKKEWRGLLVDRGKLEDIIKKSLLGLISPNLIGADQLWVSRTVRGDQYTYSQDSSKSVYPGFSKGLSGVLYLLAKAHQLGFSINNLKIPFERSLEFIDRHYEDRLMQMPAGLFVGTSGVAMALIECMRAGLISTEKAYVEKIISYFINSNIHGTGISKGVAGQGLALLRAVGILENGFIQPLLKQKRDWLVQQQQKDGSWITDIHKKRVIKATGFGYGTAGIVCFLIETIKNFNGDELVNRSVTKGLEWLIGQANKKGASVQWHIHATSSSSFSGFQDGNAGIALSLIKGYEIIGKPIYRQLAEESLRSYPEHPLSFNCTQASGLAGLGEVYLEAAKVFRSEEWQVRADWIAEFLLHHFCQAREEGCYWMPDGSPFTTAEFMEGNSGIIHFLLRYYQPKLVSHPLLPI